MANRRFPIIAISLAALVLLGYLSLRYAGRNRFDWSDYSWGNKSYGHKNDQPYGALIFRKLLDEFFSGQLVKETAALAESLPDSTHRGECYVFIGNNIHLDSSDTEHLLRFVRSGNTALIISKSVPNGLMAPVLDAGSTGDCTEGWLNHRSELIGEKVAVTLRAPNPDSVYTAYYANQNVADPTYSWGFLNDDLFCAESNALPLGYLQGDKINFVKFPYGEGSVLLHSTPLLFSNFSLTRPEMRRYATAVLSHLPNGPVYFDGGHRVPARARRDPDDPPPHLLSFILQKPSLAWAWYLLIGMTLFWLFFRSKRRYTTVPVLAKKENTSYEFINTISHLHFKSGDFKGLSIQMMKLFCTAVRERYNLTISVDTVTNQLRMDNATRTQLAAASGVGESSLLDIAARYQNTASYDVTQEDAVHLHHLLEAFWSKAN
jgi:hypothetical protein